MLLRSLGPNTIFAASTDLASLAKQPAKSVEPPIKSETTPIQLKRLSTERMVVASSTTCKDVPFGMK